TEIPKAASSLLHPVSTPHVNQHIIKIVKAMAAHQHSCPQLVVFKSHAGLIIPRREHGRFAKHYCHVVQRVSESRDPIELLGGGGHAPDRFNLRPVAVKLSDGAAHQVHFPVL